MADDKPIYNPSTNITNTSEKNPLREIAQKNIAEQKNEDYKKQLEEENRKEFEKQVKEKYKNSPDKKEQAPFLSPRGLLQRFKQQKKVAKLIRGYETEKAKTSGFGILKSKFIMRKSDKVKVMKLQNMLMKKRLLNEIEKLKLQKQVARLKGKGLLPIAPTAVPLSLRPKYPMYSDSAMQGDIDSAFNADIGTGESLYGDESYYGGEDYYTEDIYGNEFAHGDPFMELGIKIRSGVSPLLW